MLQTLLLLLTMGSAPAVPGVLDDGRLGPPAPPSSWRPSSAVECRLRLAASGVPLLRVEVTRGRDAWFVLDTGASGTTIHADLADELGLASTNSTVITTIAGEARVATVRLRDFGISGVPDRYALEAVVHDLRLVRATAPDAEGILGQDVLARHDYLIDYARRRLTVGRFPAPDAGVRLPLAWSAGRPLVQIAGVRGSHALVLDTGADVLVMERAASQDTLGDTPAAVRTRGRLETHAGTQIVDVERHVGLRLADVDLPPTSLVRMPSAAWTRSPEAGLLPASLFSRVYVSARTGIAVVWPSRE